jgi:hypothetical protein
MDERIHHGPVDFLRRGGELTELPQRVQFRVKIHRLGDQRVLAVEKGLSALLGDRGKSPLVVPVELHARLL